MEILEGIVSLVNSILWDYVLIIGLVGTGIFLSIALGFPQIKRFGKAAIGFLVVSLIKRKTKREACLLFKL